MAFVLKDRVKESTTSAGTGAIALGGAAATFDTFQSVLTDGSTTYYAIVHTSSGVDEWETGLGTWNTGNTFTRTTVLAGSNGTSPVDFSAGIKDIFMTYPASKAVYQNADSSVTLPDGLSVMGIIDGATSLEVETHIDLNTTDLTKPAHREGRIFYDEEYGALAVYNGESDITLQVGQEEWILAYNGTGSAITDGTPVYATGAVGEAISIAPADATTEEKARVVGLATHTIEDSTQGYVTVRGLVSGIDTSSLTPGQPIHLSPSGGFQNAAPTYPYYPTNLGYCISSDASDGYVYVQPTLHTYEQFRVTGNQHVDGNLTVDGDLTITGTQSVVSQASLAVDDSFIYLNSGDTIGAANTAFSGSGLDDATLTGHYNGTTSETYYVRIDGVGTGTGGVDTFEWSLDNFSTTEVTGVDCTTTDTALADGISVRFNAATGHTSGDTWSGTAAPVNVDSGTFANRNTGASGVGYTHMGWFFDVSANKFVFLEAYDPEPEGTIDLSDASVTYATLKAGSFEGDLTGNVTGDVSGNVSGTLTGNSSGTHTGAVVGNVTGDLTGNADTATALETSRTIQLTGDVIGSASFDGSANINITASVQDDSHAHVISNVDGLQSALDAKADDTTTITAGSGLTGGGSIGVNRTISHADTSTQASLTALTGAAVVSDVDVDTYGHVTGLATRNMTLADLGYTGETNATADQTITAGSGLTGGGTGDVTLSSR
jgi:cytoskeletal protein CcmA (bactofilin family)